jgi:predicted AAA+ superfamily ATPase
MDLIKKSKSILKNPLFSRTSYLEKLDTMLTTKNMLVITGQRRVGKSYIILNYLKIKKIDLDTVFYLNKEVDLEKEIKTSKDLEELFISYSKKHTVNYLIIDEIQDIEHREDFIREKLVYKQYKIIITGSNSKLLSGELATYLTGRFVTLEVFPFSYTEYLEAKKLPRTKEIFLEYLEIGGLPEIVLEQDKNLRKNYLENLLNSLLLKDIIARYRVENYSLFEKVVMFLSQNIGSMTTLRKIEDYLKKDKLKLTLPTISNYIKYLKNAYIINECERYDILGKKILEYNSKYYFNDL